MSTTRVDLPPVPSRRGLLAITVAAVLWGTIGVIVRLLQDSGMTSTSIALWRFVCATVVLVPVLGRERLRALATQLRRPGRLLTVAVSSLAFQLLYFFAVRDVGAGVATLVCLGLCPVVLHVTESVSARATPAPRTLGVLLLALVGLVLVTTGGVSAEVAPRPVLGLAEAAASGLAFALSTMWSRPLLSRLPPSSLTFVSSVVGLVLLLPVVAWSGWHVPLAPAALAEVAWLGVVTSVVAYGLFYTGLRSTPGSITMIVTLLEPVVAVVLAALVLHEALGVHVVVGGALLLAAVAALYLRASPRSAPAG